MRGGAATHGGRGLGCGLIAGCAAVAAIGLVPVAAAAQATAAPPSALALSLTGVIVDPAGHTPPVCLLRCPGARSSFVYGLRDEACGLVEIREIREDGLLVRNLATGALERVSLAPGGTAAPPAPPPVAAPAPVAAPPPMPAPAATPAPADTISVTLSRAQIERQFSNIAAFVDAVHVTPHARVVDGQQVMDGLEIGAGTDSGILEQLALRVGDVLVNFNGDALDSPAAALRLLGLSRITDRARLRILRDGRPLSILVTVD